MSCCNIVIAVLSLSGPFMLEAVSPNARVWNSLELLWRGSRVPAGSLPMASHASSSQPHPRCPAGTAAFVAAQELGARVAELGNSPQPHSVDARSASAALASAAPRVPAWTSISVAGDHAITDATRHNQHGGTEDFGAVLVLERDPQTGVRTLAERVCNPSENSRLFGATGSKLGRCLSVARVAGSKQPEA